MKTYGVTMEVSGVFYATIIAEENASPEKLKEELEDLVRRLLLEILLQNLLKG